MDVFKKASFWEKKKPFYKKYPFWAVLFAILLIASIFLSNNQDIISPDTKGAQEQKATEEIQLGYGDSASVDGISYKIQKIEKEATIPLGVRNAGSKVLTADGIFYVIRLEIINTNNGAVKLEVPKMWIVSEDYKDYFAARTDLEARFKSTIENGEVLESNSPIERIRFFDVSPGMKNLNLLIEDGSTKYYLPLSKQ